MSAPSHQPLTEADRASLQRRTLAVLWVSATASRGALSIIFPVAVLAVKDLLGSEKWAGLSNAATTTGAALSAAVLAAFMQRRGRGPGLNRGYLVAAVGAVLGIVAIQAGQLLLFLLAMIFVGVGSGTSNLSRYAAADLASPERRSRDISTVIFAATFGAVLAPLFIGVAGDLAADLGLDENAGGFGVAIGFFLLASFAIRVFLRPDPLIAAGGLKSRDEAKSDTVPFRRALSIAWNNPQARLALVALIAAQAVMVMVMGMTPIHMDDNGLSKGAVGAVISAHTAGMFAFAPLAGWLSDRFGRVAIIQLGSLTLVVATILTAFAPDAQRVLLYPGLYLLGLGWSFGIVAGSALLTESVPEGDRVGVQGAADTATSLASGIGALLSGVVLSGAGFTVLSLLGMFASAGVLVIALKRRNQNDPSGVIDALTPQ